MTNKPITPEVMDEKLPRDLVALRKFAVLLDEAVQIPGTRKRIGLDAALGFIPGVGDVVGAGLSIWIIYGALRHRVPMPKVARMVGAVLVDLLVGVIPLLGDVFDFLFKENVANVDLLIRYRDKTRPPRSWAAIMLGIGLVLTLFFLMIISAVVYLVVLLSSFRGPI